MIRITKLSERRLYLGIALIVLAPVLMAGGPKHVAGTSYFNSGVMGQPVHWANGGVRYFVDQGPLSATVTNQQATAMVDAAAALWNAIPTAGVTVVDSGSLNEDVSGQNVLAGNQTILQPSDVSATATSYPIAVIFDADGSVLDAVFGAETSDPSNCETYGVVVTLDNINPDATISHAFMIVNGRCTDTDRRMQMMSFLLERGFGLLLGLGPAQFNPHAPKNGDPQAAWGWPVMQPMSGACGFTGGTCIPNPGALRYDDMAALNRIYPITSANLASFPGKELTAANTVSIQGTISFRASSGMQGVNVVARPIDGYGNPIDADEATFVSGAYFSGDHGNVVTGWNDSNGVPLSQWGSNDPAMQGYFDLRFMPLPPGANRASYLLTFEAIDPLFVYGMAVGPYIQESPNPSGTLSPITVANLSSGASQTVTVNVADSAIGNVENSIATEAEPRLLASSGLWCGRISQVGQTDWFNFPVRGNRTFTVVTEALDEHGQPTEWKAMPAIGIWDAFAPVGTASEGTAPGLNGFAIGETWLRVTTSGDDIVRLGIADMRGDGRPDYSYNGWVLYADTVSPQRLPISGGPIVIRGMGFHPMDSVLVNGRSAQVTSVSPNEISAIAPAGTTGSVDVEVDDLSIYYAAAILSGGLSYDSANGDALTLVTAPSGTVPTHVPVPFTVKALGANLAAAGGTTVTFTVASGTATLGCGLNSCAVTASGDGSATLDVTATSAAASVVIASLLNGSSLQAYFTGGTPPTLAALNPTLSVAAGSSIIWTVQALVLSQGAPSGGQSVAWQEGTGIEPAVRGAVVTPLTGLAAKALQVGPLRPDQQATSSACLNGTNQCVSFTATGAQAESGYIEAVAGTLQSLPVNGTPSQVVLRVRDTNGNPMAGATVTLYQAVSAWAPPCPPQGRCAQAQLLANQTAAAQSGLDGTVTFTPGSVPGVATNMAGIAATGNTSTLNIAVEQHP
jgi:hypothetical protein